MKLVSSLVFLIFSSTFLLHGCGKDDQSESSGQVTESVPTEAVSKGNPPVSIERDPAEMEATAHVAEKNDKVPLETQSTVEAVAEVAGSIDTHAETIATQSQDAVSEVMEQAEQTAGKISQAVSDADDKPYQVTDGQISDNVMEGWRTYNGGGCGACHGKGGIGAVGPSLGESVTKKLSREEFFNIVTNGVSGTMMRPNNTNKRVMDNLDNLYAYLVARGDGVLGPENLIKFPMGKSE